MIRSANSRSPNAAELIGSILNRFRLTTGATAESPADHKLRVAAWLEALGVAGVPAERYDELYRRALKTRNERKAAGAEIFYLKPDDLIAEYAAIRKPETAAVGPETCPEKHNHRSPDEALQDYGFPGEAEEWLPCHRCRPHAFRRRKAEVADARAAREREEKIRARISPLLITGSGPVSDIDRELDEVTAARRVQPENEEFARRYQELLERKANAVSSAFGQ